MMYTPQRLKDVSVTGVLVNSESSGLEVQVTSIKCVVYSPAPYTELTLSVVTEECVWSGFIYNFTRSLSCSLGARFGIVQGLITDLLRTRVFLEKMD
jgi:hypothetical protein